MRPVQCNERQSFRRPVLLDPTSAHGHSPLVEIYTTPSGLHFPARKRPILDASTGLVYLAATLTPFMPAELGGSQISSLLEALPGIASVLRSPVADALIKAMRGAAGLADFAPEDAEELVRYAVRRGLIGPDEGDRVLAEVQEGLRKKKPVAVKKAPAKKKKGHR